MAWEAPWLLGWVMRRLVRFSFEVMALRPYTQKEVRDAKAGSRFETSSTRLGRRDEPCARWRPDPVIPLVTAERFCQRLPHLWCESATGATSAPPPGTKPSAIDMIHLSNSAPGPPELPGGIELSWREPPTNLEPGSGDDTKMRLG